MTDALILSLIQSSQFDDLSDYLKRGRRFSNLDDNEVQRLWIDAYRRAVGSFNEETRKFPNEPWTLQHDLAAELSLRKIEPDLDAVAVEFSRFQELIMRAVKENPPEPGEPSKLAEEYIARSRRRSN